MATKQLTPGTGILIDSTGSNVVISATQSADVRVFALLRVWRRILLSPLELLDTNSNTSCIRRRWWGRRHCYCFLNCSPYGGGGGGGAAVLGRILPVIGISPLLYYSRCAGGNGGLVNSAGNSGLASSVTGGIYMVTAAGGGGGLNGTTTTGGIGGSGGSITNQTGGAGGLRSYL